MAWEVFVARREARELGDMIVGALERNPLFITATLPPQAPVRAVTVHPEDGDRLSVRIIAKAALIPPITLKLAIESQPSLPHTPVLGLRMVTLGGLFGLASGVATGTGVILVSLLLGAGLAGPAVLATDALVTIVLDLCKAALFQRFDLLDAPAFFTGVVIGCATIPGSAIAAWLVHRMGAKLHVVFMEALILFGGAFMLWHSWR